MKEPSELEKLNAVAQAEASENTFYPLRIVMSLLSVMCVGLAIISHGNGNWESTAVAAISVPLVVFTIAVYAGWRYAPAVLNACLPLIFLMSYAGRRHQPSDIFSWGFLIALIAWLVHQEIFAFRMAYSLRRAGLPECESARQQVGSWASMLTSAVPAPGIIQFSAGDFWSNGPAIVRLFRQGNWVVVAYFFRKNLSKSPTLTVFDESATPLVYSPEHRCVRIGKREFRNVEFTPELAGLASQLEQGNAAV